jgi:hypothetical protein
VKPCTICGNAGVVEREGKLYECECAELRRIAAGMPAFIRTAPVLEAHIKALLPDGKTRIIDSINKSLYITAYQSDMRAFIKFVMIKYSHKFIRITSDREIRDVYVGSMSSKARGEFSKEAIFNNIEDLVKAPDLLLVRLGELKSRNRAAPGALEEAICYRLDRSLPLWMISDKRAPFHDSSFAWSETVGAILNSLIRVQVGEILPENYVAPPPTSLAESPLAPEQAPTRVVPRKDPVASPRQKPPRIRSVEDDENLGGLSNMGKGVKPSKRF